MAAALSAAVVLVLALPLSAAADAFAPALAELSAQGWTLAERAERKAGELSLAGFIWARGPETTMRAYAAQGEKTYLLYLHPQLGERQRFDPGWKAGLFGDKAPALLYRSENPKLRADSLIVLRFDSPRLRRVASFPDAQLRDLDGDGRPEILSRRRPLGRSTVISCGDFYALADGVQSLEVHAWREDGFRNVSASHPAFFDGEIAREEQSLRSGEAGPRESGAYAARALNLYLLYAARGRRREGWTRFSELIEPTNPLAERCVAEIKADLRRRLGVPEDWP